MNQFTNIHLPKAYSKRISRGLVKIAMLLLLCCCLINHPGYSQDVLWGLTSKGGPKGAGTAFSLKSTGAGFMVHHAFHLNPYNPVNSLIEGGNDNLYGMTSQGGDKDGGAIFKIKPNGTGFTILKEFNPLTDGGNPRGSLIKGKDGFLYGMTSHGGDHNSGTLFKISLEGTEFTVLKHFNYVTDGGNPYGSLIEGRDGFLYGMTSLGGENEDGTIFKIQPDGTGFTVLKSFYSPEDGHSPEGNLLEGSDGFLYGMTKRTIFKISISGAEFTILKTFNTGFRDAAVPFGSLIKASNGFLYGMTEAGGNFNNGTIFRIGTNGMGFTILKSFDNPDTDGASPWGSLNIGKDGFLYGMTSHGGDHNSGTLFKISLEGTEFTVLKHFNYVTDGGNPYGSLIEGRDGFLYGTTQFWGGAYNTGAIFKLDLDGTDFTILKRFTGSMDGAHPASSLTEGKDGYFYGSTPRGGEDDGGIIFKVSANDADFTILKRFTRSTYWWGGPSGNLLDGNDGNLYGVTRLGGEYDSGTIYKMALDGSTFKTIKSFNLSDGAFPKGGLIKGRDGYFYGTTASGGNYGYGTIFKISPDGTNFKVLKSFNPSTDGYSPISNLLEGSDGFIYAMTLYGGDNDEGTIFKIDTEGSVFFVLKHFNSLTDGGNPYGSLIEGRDGFLYGMTSLGGENEDGTIFKIQPDGTGFLVLKSLNATTDGASPEGSLVEDSDGGLYGLTNKGGSYNAGTIFKIDPDGTDFTVLKSLNPSTDGANPTGNLIVQKSKIPALPNPVQVNFQNRNTKTPAGWIKDYGLPFGEKQVADSSLTFGWKNRSTHMPIDLSVGGSFPGNGRWRPAPSDPLLATLIHMQGNDVKSFRGTPAESYWELAVENGDYQVTVSVGDGYRYTYSDPESHSINVEGIAAITHFVPQGSNGSLTRFKQATMKVTVSDGLLTIDADGGTNTKINYAIIQPLSSSAAIARKDFSAQRAESQVQISAYPSPFIHQLTIETTLRGNVSVSLYDLMGNTYYQASHQLQSAQFELDLWALELKSGIYLLKLQPQDGIQQLIKVVKR